MEDMTRLGVLRGKDSTGFFQVADIDKINVFKLPYSGDLVADHSRAKAIFNMADTHPITIGHHRAATRGAICLDNAHPFEHWDDKKYLVGVHNGYFGSWFSKDDGINFEVDSDWGLYRIFKDGALTALPKFTGAYALVWYENDGKVRIASNHQRELHFAFVAGKNAMLIASEHGMLHCAASRNKIKLEETILFPNSETLYTFDPKDVRAFTKEKYELPKREEKKHSNVTDLRNRDNWGRGWHGMRDDLDYEDPEPQSLLNLGGDKGTFIDGERVSFFHGDIETRLKVKMGETVEFFPNWNEVAALKKSDTHLPGYVMLADDQPLLCAMVDVTPQIKSNVLSANKETSMVECRIIGVVSSKIEGKAVDIAVVSKPTRIITVEDEANASAEVSLLEHATVPGPGGILITPIEFNHLTREGCAFCTCSLIPRDAEQGKITWHKSDTGKISPMCADCTKELNKEVV